MVEGKTEFPELKAESFQVVECLDEDVDIDLFSKAVISVVGDEHHGHPVVASVTRNLFRATTNYIYHTVFFPVAPLEGRRMPAACDKNRYHLSGEKRMRLFICGSFTSFQTTQYSQSQL
jgi:hypothetical protein